MSYPIECKGAPLNEELRDYYPKGIFANDIKRQKPIEASVTVFKDGSRQVGCPFLGRGNEGEHWQNCRKFDHGKNAPEMYCIHLVPVS